MARKSKNNALFLIAAGLLIIMFVINIGGNRTAKPIYDGQKNDFELSLISKVTPAIALEMYDVDVNVYNRGIAGSMFVQCSILDLNEHDWLKNLQAVYKPNKDNCVDNEPFTQTAKVTLNSGAEENVRFTVKTPNTPNGDNVIYCAAYEQCYDEIALQTDTMESDYFTRPIEVKPAIDSQPADDEVVVVKDEENKFDDKSIKEWMSNNKILLIGIGLGLLLIGAALIYKEPKQPVMF